ncbi:MAG: copper chaperone PCu(A)C [Chloroflexi bacterium]|nr:MAG: copper chaperone PCu(A)C [Chloroflexota bacterium]
MTTVTPGHVIRLGLAIALLVVLMGGLVACGSSAPAGPQIRAEDVWARPAVMTGGAGGMEMDKSGGAGEGGMGMGKGMAGTGAVYMTLVNEGREADRLIGAQTDVADVVEIHETKMEGDVMKMQPVAGGLEVPARGQVVLKPGGYHVMLIGLHRDLEVGDRFSLTLKFEKSGTMTVEVEVRQP